MKCPVCENVCDAKETICNICGFPGLQVEFLNEEEYFEWMRTVVAPCKEIWEETLSRNSSKFSLEQQLNQYFNYGALIQRINNAPTNYSIRSKLADYLFQIYIYRYHYPVNEREKLRIELVNQIDYFEKLASQNNDLRSKLTALEYLEKKAEIHLANGELDKTVEYYYQFLNDEWFANEIKYIKNGGEPIFALYVDLYYLILHNCSVICKIAKVGQRMIESLEELLLKIDEIRYTNYDRSYDYLYFQGMQLNIQSPKGLQDINEHLAQKGNVRSEGCTYDSCIFGPDDKPIFRCFLSDVPWIGQQCTVENDFGVWNIIDVNDEITDDLFDNHKVFMYCLKIRALFE